MPSYLAVLSLAGALSLGGGWALGWSGSVDPAAWHPAPLLVAGVALGPDDVARAEVERWRDAPGQTRL